MVGKPDSLGFTRKTATLNLQLNRGHRQPFDELRYQRAVFEVREQGSDRYARAAKHPSAAHAVRVSLNGST